MNTDRLQNDHGTAADTIRPRNTTRRRDAGASLVEVLVVLVVILIGIFAVIQIYPIGFTSLKKSESRLRADRLARSATESLTVDTSAIPESITFSFYNAGGRETITSQDPDDLGTYLGDPANKLYFSDLNKYRYITNEPIRVPLATATSGNGFGNGVGSVHFLALGPIYMDATVGNPANVPANAADFALYNSYLRVTSESLNRNVVNATGRGDNVVDPASNFSAYLTAANSYCIDYGDDDSSPLVLLPAGSIVRRPNTAGTYEFGNKDRVFTITFTYEDEVGGVTVTEVSSRDYTRDDLDVLVTTNYPLRKDNAAGWIRLKDKDGNPLPPGKSVVAGSESVMLNFARLKASDAWDPNDPYQYKLASANISTSANLGLIAFNPAGANFSVSVPGGTKPFTALASYAVLDWHILRDDREVPPGGGGIGKVRTTLPSIRVKASEFVDFTATGANRTQVYPGLYPQVPIYRPGDLLPIDSISPDIQVFNLSRTDDPATAGIVENPGTPLVAGDLANKLATDDYWINRAGRAGTYPSGTIYINTARVNPGSKVRILYKAEGDWAVAFQKAAKYYRNEEVVTPAGLRPVAAKAEVFAVDPVNGSNNKALAPFNDDRIYFHRSELNKGVTAVAEIDTAVGTTRLPARQFTITTPRDEHSFVVASDVFTELRQTQYNGNNITGWRVYGTVNGASLKTRVIWQDEQNGRNPWRISDLETFVTRQGQ